MTAQTLERADGIQKLKDALEKIKQVIESLGGTFQIEKQVKIISCHYYQVCCVLYV